MAERVMSRVELLQGTLELLILRTLLPGPSHGHAVAKHIQRTSEELLQVETGSLYPALHRLEAKGWIAASWELSEKGKRARYYRLTALGRRQLASEQSKWQAFARAVGLILRPASEESDEIPASHTRPVVAAPIAKRESCRRSWSFISTRRPPIAARRGLTGPGRAQSRAPRSG